MPWLRASSLVGPLGLLCAALMATRPWEKRGGLLPMCTLEELGEGLVPLSRRMSAGDELFPGGPVVKTALIGEIFANESAGQIPSLSAAEMGLARELVLRHVPFVIRGMSAVQRLGTTWTPAYLSSRAGSARMEVDVYKDRQFRYVHRETMHRLATADPVRAECFAKSSGYAESAIDTMAHFIADAWAHRSSTERMLYGTLVKNETFIDDDPMRGAFDELVPLVKELEPMKPRFSMGFHELDFCAHLDGFANFLAQVAGTKRIVLWNPLQEHKLYWERDSDHPYFRQSKVWPRQHRRGGAGEFSEFPTTEALQAVLHPGDVVFIPPLWFHYLEARLGRRARFWLNVNLWAWSDSGRRYMCPIDDG